MFSIYDSPLNLRSLPGLTGHTLSQGSATIMKSKSHYDIGRLLVLGLVFHLVYIGSVFDCYFTSPVVNGMESYNVGTAEAKRLVLIVGEQLYLFCTAVLTSSAQVTAFARIYCST